MLRTSHKNGLMVICSFELLFGRVLSEPKAASVTQVSRLKMPSLDALSQYILNLDL